MSQQDPAQIINNFLDDTLEKAGFTQVPPNFLAVYKKKLEELFMQKLGLEITKLLDEQGRKDLVEFLQSFEEAPKPEEVFEFYNERIPDFPQKIAGFMKDFQKSYVERARTATGEEPRKQSFWRRLFSRS